MKTSDKTIGFLLVGGIALFVGVMSSQFFRDREANAQTTTYSTGELNKELDDRIRQFFDDILNSNATKAFDELSRAGSSPLGSGTGTESIAAMRTKLDDIKKQFGDFRDYERIDVKPVGKDLVLIRYLLKCDSYPVVWTFTYYRRPLGPNSVSTVPNPWFLIGLRFDSNLDLLTLYNRAG